MRFIVSFVCLFLITATVAGAEDYQIKIVRPDKVGDEYTTSITASVSQTFQKNLYDDDDSKKTDSFTAACQGNLKVLAVDEKGKFATRIRFQVDSMTKNEKELYPEGTVIIAKIVEKETTFEIDGVSPDDEHEAVLQALLNLTAPNGITNEDETNGTDKSQKVGDTWPINADKLKKELGGRDGNPSIASQISGESKLVSIKDVSGTQAMVIKSTVTANGVKKDLPDGSSISDGKITSDITAVYPVDPALPIISLQTKVSMTLTMVPHFGNNKSVWTIKRDRKERREPVTP
jgi:hypothetical protein